MVEIDEAYLAELSLAGLKTLAALLVLDVDVSEIEDRDVMLHVLRSNAL